MKRRWVLHSSLRSWQNSQIAKTWGQKLSVSALIYFAMSPVLTVSFHICKTLTTKYAIRSSYNRRHCSGEDTTAEAMSGTLMPFFLPGHPGRLHFLTCLVVHLMSSGWTLGNEKMDRRDWSHFKTCLLRTTLLSLSPSFVIVPQRPCSSGGKVAT